MTADDIIAYEKKLRWFQLLKDFNCTVTSTWTNNEESCEFHTWRAWGSRGRKKQLDDFLGPRNLPSETRWAGWTPVSEGEVAKFQELVLRPRGPCDEVALCEAEDGEGLGPST